MPRHKRFIYNGQTTHLDDAVDEVVRLQSEIDMINRLGMRPGSRRTGWAPRLTPSDFHRWVEWADADGDPVRIEYGVTGYEYTPVEDGS